MANDESLPTAAADDVEKKQCLANRLLGRFRAERGSLDCQRLTIMFLRRMTKPEPQDNPAASLLFRISSFGFLSDFVIRHSSFVIGQPVPTRKGLPCTS